jgi:hypothetical protein
MAHIVKEKNKLITEEQHGRTQKETEMAEHQSSRISDGKMEQGTERF